MANNTLIASDNFTRANGGIGANWTTITGQTASNIVSNTAEPTATSVFCSQFYNAVVWTKNQSSEVTVGAGWVNEAGTQIRVNIRVQSGSYSGYEAVIANTQVQLFRIDAASGTQLGSTLTGLTMAAGDVWTIQAAGTVISLYQNSTLIIWAEDATYTSGSGGFAQISSVNISHVQLASWRGYSAVQQDGIWTKQGITVAPLATEFISAMQNPCIIYEGNAQILSGNVYKMWAGAGTTSTFSVVYFESTDGINWTRYAGVANGYVISGTGGLCVKVIKVAGTYYLYCNTSGNNNIQQYTSSDGINWTQAHANVFTSPGAGHWDSTSVFYFSPIIVISGTWYALYTGIGIGTIATGLATSPDGVTWTRYVSNPVVGNFWGIVEVFNIGGTYYAWGQANNPGQGSGKNFVDPGEGVRMQTADFITWTNRVHSHHHSQMFENVNGVKGGCYQSFPVNVGNKAYMYSTSAMDDVDANSSVVGGYQISLAIGPSTIANIVAGNEDALQQTTTDAFQRADENPLSGGGNWHSISGEGNLKIVSHNVEATANAGSAMAFTGSVFANDQYSSITIGTLGVNGYAFPIVRAATGANTFYYAAVHGATNSSGTVTLQKIVAGAGTQLGPSVAYTPQAADVFTLSIIGNVLSLYQNGYLLLQAQDFSSSIASGSPGIGMNPVSATLSNAIVTAWAGGNANVIPVYPPIVGAVGWSPVDSRQAVKGFGPSANTGIVDAQGNVIYSAQDPPFTGNSQVSDNVAIPPADCRKAGAPVDSRKNVPVNSRVAPPFKS